MPSRTGGRGGGGLSEDGAIGAEQHGRYGRAMVQWWGKGRCAWGKRLCGGRRGEQKKQGKGKKKNTRCEKKQRPHQRQTITQQNEREARMSAAAEAAHGKPRTAATSRERSEGNATLEAAQNTTPRGKRQNGTRKTAEGASGCPTTAATRRKTAREGRQRGWKGEREREGEGEKERGAENAISPFVCPFLCGACLFSSRAGAHRSVDSPAVPWRWFPLYRSARCWRRAQAGEREEAANNASPARAASDGTMGPFRGTLPARSPLTAKSRRCSGTGRCAVSNDGGEGRREINTGGAVCPTPREALE